MTLSYKNHIQMLYRPHLFFYNIGNMPGNFFRKVVQQHKLGKVGQIEIRKGTQENTALVKMKDWNLPKTTSTRLKLQQGKPLLLCDNDNGFWKTYAYECRENELRARRREIDFMRKKEN